MANHTEVLSLIDSVEKDDEFEKDEIEQEKHIDCSDPKTWFRIDEAKCIFYYDTQSDDVEG